MRTVLCALLFASSSPVFADSIQVDGPACDSLKMQKLQLEITTAIVTCKQNGCSSDQMKFFLAGYRDIHEHHCETVRGKFKVVSRSPTTTSDVSIVEIKTPKGSRWVLDY